MPHYQLDAGPVPAEPMLPKMWETGLRFWIKREGLLWGVYWAIRSRRINAVKQEAYLQRHDKWAKDVAETLWERHAL